MILLLNKGTPNNDKLVKTDFQRLRLKKCKFLNSCSLPAPRLIFLHMGPSENWIYTPNKNLNRKNDYYPGFWGTLFSDKPIFCSIPLSLIFKPPGKFFVLHIRIYLSEKEWFSCSLGAHQQMGCIRYPAKQTKHAHTIVQQCSKPEMSSLQKLVRWEWIFQFMDCGSPQYVGYNPIESSINHHLSIVFPYV
jgi:hypothetical protein